MATELTGSTVSLIFLTFFDRILSTNSLKRASATPFFLYFFLVARAKPQPSEPSPLIPPQDIAENFVVVANGNNQ